MPGPPDLTTWRHDEAFLGEDTPIAVLDHELVIRAVNPAHERATGFLADQLVSRFVFDAYPASPADPDGDENRETVERSFERVLREGRPHDLVVQRYDVPDTADPRRFVTKVWAPVTVPVRHGGTVVGVACRAPELRLPDTALRTIAPLRDELRRAAESDDPLCTRIVEAVAWGLREYAAALAEVGQLKEALTSRATIDQAKGVLMAERHCSPDEAFQLLVKLSNDTNVRLADVASAVVYQAREGA